MLKPADEVTFFR